MLPRREEVNLPGVDNHVTEFILGFAISAVQSQVS